MADSQSSRSCVQTMRDLFKYISFAQPHSAHRLHPESHSLLAFCAATTCIVCTVRTQYLHPAQVLAASSVSSTCTVRSDTYSGRAKLTRVQLSRMQAMREGGDIFRQTSWICGRKYNGAGWCPCRNAYIVSDVIRGIAAPTQNLKTYG